MPLDSLLSTVFIHFTSFQHASQAHVIEWSTSWRRTRGGMRRSSRFSTPQKTSYLNAHSLSSGKVELTAGSIYWTYYRAPFSGGCLCTTDGLEVVSTSSPKAGEYVFNVDGKPVSCDARPRLILQTVARSRLLEGPSIFGKGLPQTPRRGS